MRWAEGQMPVLRSIRDQFARDKPLAGLRIGACLHVTTETANLMIALKAAGGVDCAVRLEPAVDPGRRRRGARRRVSASRPLPSKARTRQTYYRHIEAVLATRPNITMDDGCDLVNVLHTRHADQLGDVHRRDRRDHDRRDPPARHDARRAIAVPGRGRQRGAHQAHVRQPLRDGPEHARRADSGDQRAARRADVRRVPATAGAAAGWRRAPTAWARTSSSPKSTHARARSADGRLSGHAADRGGQSRPTSC